LLPALQVSLFEYCRKLFFLGYFMFANTASATDVAANNALAAAGSAMNYAVSAAPSARQSTQLILVGAITAEHNSFALAGGTVFAADNAQTETAQTTSTAKFTGGVALGADSSADFALPVTGGATLFAAVAGIAFDFAAAGAVFTFPFGLTLAGWTLDRAFLGTFAAGILATALTDRAPGVAAEDIAASRNQDQAQYRQGAQHR